MLLDLKCFESVVVSSERLKVFELANQPERVPSLFSSVATKEWWRAGESLFRVPGNP